MANTITGNVAGWGGKYVAEISGAVTLTKADAGKVFLCAAATVTLPTAADSAGWNAIFIHKSGTSTVNSITINAAGELSIVVCDGSAFYSGNSNT
tara:strand:- start:8633 stop:8917 length:285 start_codon:yes stop_codon:yes gene_type:complete